MLTHHIPFCVVKMQPDSPLLRAYSNLVNFRVVFYFVLEYFIFEITLEKLRSTGSDSFLIVPWFHCDKDIHLIIIEFYCRFLSIEKRIF